MPADEIEETLHLSEINDRPWNIQACSAQNGEGKSVPAEKYKFSQQISFCLRFVGRNRMASRHLEIEQPVMVIRPLCKRSVSALLNQSHHRNHLHPASKA